VLTKVDIAPLFVRSKFNDENSCSGLLHLRKIKANETLEKGLWAAANQSGAYPNAGAR